MPQKRTPKRSSSNRDIVVDRHLMAEESFYMPQNKVWDPDAPAGAKALSLNTGTDGKTRPVILTSDGPVEVALKGENTSVGGTPVLNYDYGFSQGTAYPAPSQGQEQTPAPDSRMIIYVDRDSTETPKAQYTWSNTLNAYVRYNTTPVAQKKYFPTKGTITYEQI